MTEATSTTTTTTSTNWLLVLSYATIVGLWGATQYVLVPYVVHLLVLVTAILYAACHSSLLLREEPNLDGATGDASTAAPLERETLRKEDAYQFPIVGSISLCSLYLAFKYLDKDVVNMLIGGYFGVVGCLAITITFSPLIRRFTPKAFHRVMGWEWKINHSLPEMMVGPSPLDLGAKFTGADIISFVGAVVICFFYFQSKPWYLNNVLGICFCLQGISRFSLGTYKIGAILLVGLFVYDIVFVFGTEIMVT